MSRLLLIIVMALAAISCDDTTIKAPNKLQETMDNIRYIEEPRKHICFAMVGSVTYYGYSVTSITTVPMEACR